VARGTVILAEYTEFTGNFTTIASQCLMEDGFSEFPRHPD
jgi:vesicle-associated membrane protein 72